MGFFDCQSLGGRGEGKLRAPHNNFVVTAPMMMTFGAGIKLVVFYTMVRQMFVTSLLLRNYNVIICILADA